MTAADVHEFTHEIFDPSLKPIDQSGDEVRYFCPVCPDKRGKPDTKGKMYFNVVKMKGYCFLCHTAFVTEDKQREKDEIEWNKLVDAISRGVPNSIFETLEFPAPVHFDFPLLTADLIRYLKGRNPFLLPLIDVLGIHAWKGRDTGVVLPFAYKGAVCKYQCRFNKRLKPDAPKYYTSEGPKILYSPMHIFNDFHPILSEEITICEGVFDAIALCIMGFHNPVAVLGDKLTPLQIHDIRYLTPPITRITISLDDLGRCREIERIVKKFLPCVETTEILCGWAPFKDPEEWLVGALQQNPEFRQECAERVRAWVQAYNNSEETV